MYENVQRCQLRPHVLAKAAELHALGDPQGGGERMQLALVALLPEHRRTDQDAPPPTVWEGGRECAQEQILALPWGDPPQHPEPRRPGRGRRGVGGELDRPWAPPVEGA